MAICGIITRQKVNAGILLATYLLFAPLIFQYGPKPGGQATDPTGDNWADVELVVADADNGDDLEDDCALPCLKRMATGDARYCFASNTLVVSISHKYFDHSPRAPPRTPV